MGEEWGKGGKGRRGEGDMGKEEGEGREGEGRDRAPKVAVEPGPPRALLRH